MRILIPEVSGIQVFCRITDLRWEKFSGELLATNYELQHKKYIHISSPPFLPVTPHIQLSLWFLDFSNCPQTHSYVPEQQVPSVARALALLPSLSISGTWCPAYSDVSAQLFRAVERRCRDKEAVHLSCK